MADPARINDLVTRAGFPEPEIQEIAFTFDYPDSDDVWEAIVRIAGPLAEVIKPPDEDERENPGKPGGVSQEDGSYLAPAASWGIVSGR